MFFCTLTFAELRSPTCSFETVLLSFLHTRVSREESCLLQKGTVAVVCQKKRTGYAVTDCACLSGNTAALYVCYNVKLAEGVRYSKGLVDDQLQCLKSEVIVNVASVDCDFAASGIESYSRNGALSSSRTIEIRFSTCVH